MIQSDAVAFVTILITAYLRAQTRDEVEKLLETGFDYVCDMDDAKFFRKRK